MCNVWSNVTTEKMQESITDGNLILTHFLLIPESKILKNLNCIFV